MTYRQIQFYLKYVIGLLFIGLLASTIFPLINLLWVFLSAFIVVLLAYNYRIGKIKETTLCFIVKDKKVLMMLRNKKAKDVHLNKYNGLGGGIETGESKVACVLREVDEEAGIKLTDYKYVGKVTFKDFGYKKGKEVMYCFVGYKYQNEIGYCNEGTLEWIDKDKVLDLPLWDGDQYFLLNIIEGIPFNAFLQYKDDKVIHHKIKLKGK